jgi:Coenzyme PQQ synthesis protein D (PqqD)
VILTSLPRKRIETSFGQYCQWPLLRVSDVAREIWEAAEQPKKISDLVDDLMGTFNIDRAKCEQETLSFLEDLRSEGLLQVSDAPAS